MTARSPDAIVVGAGIVGAACAAAFARAGLRVTIVEADFAASGTTAAGMGHIVAMDDSAEQLALTGYSQRLWAELSPRLPVEAEVDDCGTLWVAEDARQLEVVRAKQRVYASAGIVTQHLDARELAEAEPQLREGLAGALRAPADSIVYPPGATLHLLTMARDHGAAVHEHTTIDSIGAHEVRTGGGSMRAEVIVNAAGASAATLTPGLPIVPRKGHLAITDRYPGFCRHQIVELGYLASAHEMTAESVAFNVQPRRTGQLLIGSSRELVGWDASTNHRVLGQMLRRACDFLPRLSSLSIIRTWTGFRPATPDALPLIGSWDPVPGLWIAAGHEGLGITTSLGTAQLLADLVTGRSPAIDPAPYAPVRALAPAAVAE
jgi:D-hydroxyproline dehydrogenase subunit beta